MAPASRAEKPPRKRATLPTSTFGVALSAGSGPGALVPPVGVGAAALAAAGAASTQATSSISVRRSGGLIIFSTAYEVS